MKTAVGYVGWGLALWLVVVVAMLQDLKRQQFREVRRYVSVTCSDGIPPEDFHTEALDRTLHGVLGPDLVEGCHVMRRRYEAIVAEDHARSGKHWASEELPVAVWRLR